MKFIVDAQLPKSLSDFLNSRGHDSIHTLELPELNKTKDFRINELAAKDDRIVITKDYDFLDSFLLKRQPQKLILVKTGNIRNSELLIIFNQHIDEIAKLFLSNSLIEINRAEIVVHV